MPSLSLRSIFTANLTCDTRDLVRQERPGSNNTRGYQLYCVLRICIIFCINTNNTTAGSGRLARSCGGQCELWSTDWRYSGHACKFAFFVSINYRHYKCLITIPAIVMLRCISSASASFAIHTGTPVKVGFPPFLEILHLIDAGVNWPC